MWKKHELFSVVESGPEILNMMAHLRKNSGSLP